MIQVGGALARARRERGITQYELAQRTGIQQAAISRIENGRGNATLDVIESFAKALMCKCASMLRGEEPVSSGSSSVRVAPSEMVHLAQVTSPHAWQVCCGGGYETKLSLNDYRFLVPL